MLTVPTEYLSLVEASRALGRPGRALADALYRGQIDPAALEVVAGRRVVRRDQLPWLAEVLSRDRRLKEHRQKVQ